MKPSSHPLQRDIALKPIKKKMQRISRKGAEAQRNALNSLRLCASA
jgi:hypothetical protein